MSKTLIINYAFPPNEGVGGRRWAKFCKYMHRANEDFVVVCKQPVDTVVQSKWQIDAENFIDKITFFDFGYPSVLEQNEFSITDKIKYRIALKKVKLLSKGNYYDRSCLSGKRFKAFIRKLLIEENITTIVVSVAPFGIAKNVGELKDEFKDVKFIVDFRDPWIDNETSYGFASMSESRKHYEVSSEGAVVQRFDTVVSVSNVMTDNFIKRYPKELKSKFKTIPNGFDLDDVSKKEVFKQSDKINLVFIGTFYEQAKHHIATLFKHLEFIKKRDVNTYKRISINFYGSNPFKTNGLDDVITFHKPVSIEKVSEVLSIADAGLLFLSDDINYSFSTKFCEYLAHKLPIIVFSKSGKTGEFIERNNIGIEINGHSNELKLLKMMQNIEEIKSKTLEFNTMEFNVESLVQSFVKEFY